MKISYNWLKEYIIVDLEPQKLGEILTGLGLEIEGIETYEQIKGNLKNYLIGEVLTCQKHPNADKLSVTTVNVGSGEPLHIVCGAPNVAAGQKVVVATIGAEVHMGDKSFTIQKTKLRGELSEGMICAEDELGLGTSHDGILVLDKNAKPGTAAAEFFNLKSDTIFEIGLTPNRIDAASHYGVARDLAAYLSLNQEIVLKKPDISGFKEVSNVEEISVSVEDINACKRYSGITIRNIKIAPSPEWLQERLKSIGLNPINNIVDITNFVAHELGQPLHAFDADILSGGKIVVRKMAEGTKFITLDGVERSLSTEDLMICDGKEGSCLAGVFGGLNSGVTENTKNIFIESACFDSVSVRRSAKRHGLNTDASYRCERGTDPNNTVFALKRAAILINEIIEGVIISKITDIYPVPVKPFSVEVNYNHIDRLIGKKLDRALIKKILSLLDIQVEKESGDILNLLVAPYRVDVTREADVIEEILRVYGYNNVEFSLKVNASLSPTVKPDNELIVNQVSDFLASNGFNEIMSNSLTKNSYFTNLETYPEKDCVEIVNPLSSDLSVLRQTLLFSGLEAIIHNINRQNQNLRLFEYGRCYKLTGKTSPDDTLAGYFEDRRIALFLTGNKSEPSWTGADEKVSFFYLKAICEKIIEKLGIDIENITIQSLETKADIFSGGLTYSLNKTLLFEIGTVNPKLLKQFDIEQEVLYAEIRWDELIKLYNSSISFKEMPKFPEVRRDLALLIDKSVEFADIKKISMQTERKLLKRVTLFDFYTGKGIADGKKSYGVSFYLQDEAKTLTDNEIDRIMSKISDRILKEFKADLR